MSRLEELTGVLPALISPLSGDGKVDEPAVIRLVEHVIGGGGDRPPGHGAPGEEGARAGARRPPPPCRRGAAGAARAGARRAGGRWRGEGALGRRRRSSLPPSTT